MQEQSDVIKKPDKKPDESASSKSKSTKKGTKKSSKKRNKKATRKRATQSENIQAKYPRHSLQKALRFPRAVLEQNAGKECSEAEAAAFVGLQLVGPTRVEISSAIKFGLLERPAPGRLKITDLAKKILRPQQPKDEVDGLREAVLKAPDIADVYKHYRGENLPDEKFFDNALVDNFHLPESKLSEFKEIFIETLLGAQLLEEHNNKYRVIDISQEDAYRSGTVDALEKLGKSITVSSSDSCFVVMPFELPLGGHYSKIYEPAIKKAGLRPVRADDEIFATGKIIDQVWAGINAAKVLVAELTSRNPNVFYELGLAHALRKPVVLISSNENDVPFDVRHIRVIYYDVNDPFWGDKLMAKVAENILSAIKNPDEAIFRSSADGL